MVRAKEISKDLSRFIYQYTDAAAVQSALIGPSHNSYKIVGNRFRNSCLSRRSVITYIALLQCRSTPQNNVLRMFGLLSLSFSVSHPWAALTGGLLDSQYKLPHGRNPICLSALLFRAVH